MRFKKWWKLSTLAKKSKIQIVLAQSLPLEKCSLVFNDIWRTHQFFGLIFAAAVFSYLVIQTMGKAYALALFYSLASAIYLFQNPDEVWPGLMIRIDATAANAAVILILVSAVVAFVSLEVAAYLFSMLFTVVLINCWFVLFNGHGMFHACSMDTAAAALFLPYALRMQKCLTERPRDVMGWLKYLPAALILLTIAVTHGTTAFVMLLVMGLAYLRFTKAKSVVLGICAIVALAGIFSLWRHIGAADDTWSARALTSGRMRNWTEMFSWWGPNANNWFGTGSGSYQWLSPAIVNRKTEVFLWMHNEFLQGLFEQGALGLGLFLLVGASVLVKSASNPWLFTTFTGLSVMCLTQFPFRFFVTQLAIVFLIRFAQPENKNPSAQLPKG